MTNQYESPFSSRYSSDYMKELFSADTRYKTWRKLWVSLARAEMKLGLPVTWVTEQQRRRRPCSDVTTAV